MERAGVDSAPALTHRWRTADIWRLVFPWRAGILTRCPQLRAARGHVAAFAAMMSELGGERLDAWMRAVETDDLPALHSLVPVCAVTTPRSPQGSPCPTALTPSKARSTASRHSAMYGRANLDLLRQRILIPH